MDWKDFHKLILIPLALVLTIRVYGQNLVPNPSFEEYTECPEHTGRIVNALPWKNVRVSCDYYHECGTNGAGIPISDGGGGYARTGQAYAGFKVWCINDVSGVNREILGIQLTETLIEGEVYRVEFYLSMLDSIWYASQNVGAYFSVEQPNEAIDSIENYQPQVQYSGDFITEKQGWIRVSGSFVAQGGEKFMSIGNFDKYEDTEVQFVPGGGVAPSHSSVYWSCSEYFIDDVSVVALEDTVSGIAEAERLSFSVYPNPTTSTSTLTWQGQPQGNYQLELYDVHGKQVLQNSGTATTGKNTQIIDMSAYAKGIYFGRFVVGEEMRTFKVVRE